MYFILNVLVPSIVSVDLKKWRRKADRRAPRLTKTKPSGARIYRDERHSQVHDWAPQVKPPSPRHEYYSVTHSWLPHYFPRRLNWLYSVLYPVKKSVFVLILRSPYTYWHTFNFEEWSKEVSAWAREHTSPA